MSLLKRRGFINKKSIYKNTNKNFPIVKKKKCKRKRLNIKKFFYLFLLIEGRYKMGKIRMMGIGSIVGWASAHRFYSFLWLIGGLKPTLQLNTRKYVYQGKNMNVILTALLNTLHNLARQFRHLVQIKLKLT